MDPQAAFLEMLMALRDQDWEYVQEAADALRMWINHGGFPPETLGADSLGHEWHGTVAAFVCDLAASRALDALAEQTREGVC
jgi:hypothetical protein